MNTKTQTQNKTTIKQTKQLYSSSHRRGLISLYSASQNCVIGKRNELFLVPASAPMNELNVLFNDALNTLYLPLYGVGHM